MEASGVQNHTSLVTADNARLNSDKIDQKYMAAAIRYARQHEGLTAENPSVGALIVRFNGDAPTIVGRGVTAIGGRPHAEVIALQEAGAKAHGACAYVTLEPCSHFGQTPPCANALIQAGITRVVVAANDPDPRVAGNGFDTLRAAGIEVVTDVMAQEAEYGLAGYLMRKTKNRPFVTLKLAMTADNFIGASNGEQVKITDKISNGQVQIMRAINDAILVGIGTVINDDPNLTCRLTGLEHRSPIRVVLDRKLQMSARSKLVQTAKQHKLILATQSESEILAALVNNDVDIVSLKSADNKAQLNELLQHLAINGISTVLVEGGAQVAASFLNAGLVDRLVIFQSSDDLEIEDRKLAVAAPITPQKIGSGFSLKNQLTFGSDIMYEYDRTK